MIELVFLGHQTWLLSCDDTHVLLDPVVGQNFGNCPGVEFRVYPPRTVDVASMPRVDALLLSHEHLDHFHIESLDRLPRDAPMYVGSLMPTCVTDAVERLGFSTQRVHAGTPFRIGALELTLFSAPRDTVFWEKRVTQVLVREADRDEPGVFIGIDALISDDFIEQVEEGAIASPRAIVVANNSQLAPPGAHGSYSNLLPIEAGSRADPRFPGVSLLYSLFVSYVQRLPDVPNIILCGNGFVSLSESFGPFMLSDNRRLAELANELGYGRHAYGPRPGESLTVRDDGSIEEGTVSWIRPDHAQHAALLERHAQFLASPHEGNLASIAPPFVSEAEEATALEVLERELVQLARYFMQSKVVLSALATDEYLQGPLGSRRLAMHFVGFEGRSHVYALDLAKSRFVRVDTPPEQLLDVYPYGLVTHLQDFVAMLEGRLQIWDLAGNAMRSWFLTNIYDAVVPCLYEAFGEQVRPDLADRVYDAAIERTLSER